MPLGRTQVDAMALVEVQHAAPGEEELGVLEGNCLPSQNLTGQLSWPRNLPSPNLPGRKDPAWQDQRPLPEESCPPALAKVQGLPSR